MEGAKTYRLPFAGGFELFNVLLKELSVHLYSPLAEQRRGSERQRTARPQSGYPPSADLTLSIAEPAPGCSYQATKPLSNMGPCCPYAAKHENKENFSDGH
jgi:hypothetical protein